MQILRTSALKRLCSNDAKRFFFSVFFVFLFLVFTCCFYSPRWETNDDIAMSMVAHGYGLAAYSSPQIIFSNVLWGHVVRNIPSVFGVLGYSLATLFSLFASGVGILYFLRRLGVGWTASAAVTVLALLRPAIFPQFTLNSGLLTIVAVLALVHYVQVRKARILGVALLFGLVGFLIRSHQFAIVLFASLPFLQLNVLYRDRKFRLFVLSFLALLSFAIGVDWLSYCGPEWAQFFEINGARAAYTDFGLATQLKRSPEIIQARGYSNNDLDLITSFFFSDPSITRPENLREMQTALGTLPFVAANVPLVLAAVESFFSVTILPITALACVLFAFRPSRKGAAAFLLVISCASLLGLIGRGGLDRVLAPLVTMLAIFSMINISRYEGSSERRRVVALGTFSVLKCSLAMLAVAATFWFVNRQALVAREQVQISQDEARRFPKTLIFSWGVGIRIESIFPVLANDSTLQDMRIYGLGVFTHAPFSRAHTEEVEGRGFVPRIRTPEGISIVASDGNIALLRIWCQERFGSTLVEEDLVSGSMMVLKRVSCAV